jgi:group I intron endonuclease
MNTKQKMRLSGVYAIWRQGTDECYVGQSSDIDNRWRLHLQDLVNKRHHSRYLQRVVDKHGTGCLRFEVLETDLTDVASLLAAEQRWFDKLKPCYNSAPVAGSTLGLKFSEEGRANVSIAQRKRFEDPMERAKAGNGQRGKPSPWRGRTPSLETRAKQSAAKMGKPSAFKGCSHSAESLKKISAAKIGQPSPNKGRPRSLEANAKQSASMKAHWARQKQQELIV